jgi:hypothetical protein
VSDCDVCIGGGDRDGYPEFQEIKDVKARKPHKCVECRRVIEKGETYQRYSGKFDGAVFTDHTCEECASIRSVYSCGEAWPCVGEMWSEMEDHGFAHLRMAGECWDKLSAAAKAKLLERWRAWKGL